MNLKKLAAISVSAVLPLLINSNPAMAFSSYLTDFKTAYPSSTTATTAWSSSSAQCNICHSSGGGTDLNGYGKDWAAQHNGGLSSAAAFAAIEGLNSDNDPTGSTNLQEITAGAQPGWTPGSNQLYDIFALTPTTTASPPANLTGPADPVPVNLPPVANAGPNQAVNVGQQVQLNGSASSDPEGQLLTYSWAFTSKPTGSAATLTNPTTVNPTFTPDVAGSYVVQLTVNDGTQNNTNTNTNTVTIAAAPAANLPPVANAGPNQAVNVGQQVQLNGSASSDPEGQLLTYSWSFVSVPTGSGLTALTNPATVNPTFTPDVAGSYVVQLTVNDGTQNNTNTNTNTVTIAAAPAANLPPVANAGPNQAVNVGQQVQLNGSASSDPEGQLLTYSWSFVSVPTGSGLTTLTNPTTVNPTFTPDVAGSYVVQLTVNDGTQNNTNTNTNTVTIAATAQNLPPVANAGPNQTINVGQLVTLDGSASSDPEGQLLTYSWSFVSVPTGSGLTALTNPTTVNPTFTPDVAGSFVVGLVVNDGTFNSTNTANVTITANAAGPSGSPGNLPPVANGGPNQAVAVGQLATLDGSGSSDPQGHALTYSWAFTSKPMGSTATLMNPTAVNPTFTPDVAGSYTAKLVVSNGTQSSTNLATVVITAQTAQTAPSPTGCREEGRECERDERGDRDGGKFRDEERHTKFRDKETHRGDWGED